MERGTFALFALFLCLATSAWALDAEISLGREDGWSSVDELESVVIHRGLRDYTDISLKQGEYLPNDDVDMLIHFDSTLTDATGNYHASGEAISINQLSKLGGSAGLFRGEPEGLSLTPRRMSMFSPGSVWNDFTIEFWLYPATLGEGETILLWRGSRIEGDVAVPQEIRVSIRNRRIVWKFVNVFYPAKGGLTDIELVGFAPVVPRSWRHHLVRFDRATGLLEYVVDGRSEDVTYASASGREEGEVYPPYTGDASETVVILGSGLHAVLDEFRISSRFISEPFVDVYPLQTGRFTTRVFDLEYSNSLLKMAEANISTPGDTGVSFFYRMSNTKTHYRGIDANWLPFLPGEKFGTNTRGRYLQILVELFPDGTGSQTPTVHDLTIIYEPDAPPIPPAIVTATPENGSIHLSWSDVADTDLAGYLVYYGIRPGNYFGLDSSSGPSPIDVGMNTSFTLKGLENGKLYYFAICSYDSSEPPHRSSFSREISARPSQIHGKR